MKRILLICVACTALLWSCAKDDILSVDRSMVTFSLSSSDDATRAYGNGLRVKDLRYAIYAEGDYSRPLVERTRTNVFSGSLTTTIKEELIAGNRYTILFWADSDAGSATYINNTRARYSIDWDACTVTLNTGNLTANNEDYDAFFAKVDFTASNNGNVPVVLRRPFAQLNIATSDIDKAADLGVTITKTALLIEACTTLNLLTGKATTPQHLTFEAAEIPSASASIEVEGTIYKPLSMNYILVDGEQSDISTTLAVYGTKSSGDDDVENGNGDDVSEQSDGGESGQGEELLFTTTFDDLTLKRNSRTNVVGQIILKNILNRKL